MSPEAFDVADDSILRGRYAPSPTGEIHLGNASTALLAWLSVRARGGLLLQRIEDLDRARVREGLDLRILEDLRWLGLDWDEGPDCGGPHAPYEQSARLQRYDAAFEKLKQAGQLYPCFCSRRDIAMAASAPQEPGDELRYPGTCSGLSAAEGRAAIAAGNRHAWRFRVGERQPAFDDLVWGACGGRRPPGDFVVRRSDGVPAYQLAVVVDDIEMQVTEVVRGDDLLDSTARQLLLFESLGAAPPRFGHVPLLMGPDGHRLSKRHAGITLRELREAGSSAERIVGLLAGLLGLRPDSDPLPTASLVEGFDLSRLSPVPDGIVVDPRLLQGRRG